MKKSCEGPQNALQFFGFRYPPFADTFEIASPFECEADLRILHRTSPLLKQGKSIALYGESGSGKSMLIKSIIVALDPKEYRIAHIPYGGIKPSALLRDLCDELGIDTTGRKNLLTRIALDFQRSSGKPFPVIVVDEAHEMQRQSFVDLCSVLFDTKRCTAASLILVGQPQLRKMLELDIFAPVRTRLTGLFSMPTLTIDDARAFIAFRLDAAEAKSSPFDDDAVTSLAADCKGNRRVLMNLAALALEEAARRKEKIVTADIVNAITSDN
jgi:type II secretory pathway predicted ATPase ExeA